MRIGFAITDPEGGGCQYRGHLPARALRARGHDVVVGETVRYGDNEWRLGLELDVASDEHHAQVASREDWPGGNPAVNFYTDEAGTTFAVFVPDVLVVTAGWSLGMESLLGVGEAAGGGMLGRNAGQVLVVDYDDGLEAPPDNAGYRPDQLTHKVASALRADRLTCSTPKVAHDLVAVRRPTSVVRNAIDRTMFGHAHAVNQARLAVRIADEVEGELVVGYRGPLPWHRLDVEALRGSLGPLVEMGCTFVHIGARDDDEATFAQLVGLEDRMVERRPHVPFADYPDLLAGIDLGLVPFARRAWSTYKSNIGGLEWNAAGVPWLASDQPEYRRLHSGSIVAGRFGWGARVRELLNPVARYDRWHSQHTAGLRFDVADAGRGRAWERALGIADE